jgi:hypothetical protein
MNFNSRETYLNAVAQWKAEYKTHSEYLRGLKQKRDQLQRDGKDCAVVQWDIIGAKRQANELLTERQDGKVDAQLQYEATRSLKQAA